MSHLEDMAAALVDNELSADQRDRALAHIAGCDDCRTEVDGQRRLKALLANQPAPQPRPELASRLRAVAHPVPPVPVAPPRLGAPSGRGSRLRRAPARFFAGATSAAAVLLAVALAVGGGEPAEPGIAPPVGVFVDEHNATTDQLPLHDPAASVVVSSYDE